MSITEPLHEICHLAMVEMYTKDFDASLEFFTQILGMSATEQEDGVAYLRAYEDRYHHSVKLIAGKEAGVGAVCWRANSPEALERRVAALTEQGIGGQWVEGHKGYGRAYEFQLTSGHRQRIFWEVEYFKPTAEQKSRLLSRAQKRPSHGVPVKRMDHLNLMSKDPAADAKIMMDCLGFRKTERAAVGDMELACWLTPNSVMHELALTGDRFGEGNRLHHVSFWYGNPGQLLEAADLLTELDIHIEAGPARHGISQAYFLYFYEPGGNRLELFGDTGYLIMDPEWKCVTWDEESFWKDGAIWFGGDLPQDFFIYGTPIVEDAMKEIERINEGVAKVFKGE